MGISLRNAMKLGKFNECKVVAGHDGLTRMVENVTIMEVPEVVQWLKGKELILTSLFAIKDDIEAQNMLVQHLHSAGATALAIKPSQFIEQIPEGMIASGNKLGFPIIEIPDPVKYLDILSPVMHHIFNDKVVLQEDLEQASKVLHEISLSAQGIQEFLNNVSYLTKNVITIESGFSFVDVPEPPVDISPLTEDQIYELSVIRRPLHLKREYNGQLVSSIAAPIMNDGEYYGNITCWEVNNENLPIDLAILEKASSLLSLEFLKLRVKYEIEQQYKRDFMRELLFSENIREKNIIEWGGKYHITRDSDYVCLLLSFQGDIPYDENNMQLKDYQLDAAIRKIHPNALVGHLKNGICIILPVQEGHTNRIYEDIYGILSEESALAPPLSLGVGRPGKGPEGIQNSYAQAEKAIDLNKTINRSEGICYYDALGAYRLLDQLKEEKELKDFYGETVGKLIEQDSNHELIKTLKAYFFHDEVLKNTAEALFIHINTLKYRTKKIEEITGCSLRSSEGKMNLFLGLKIHELLYQNEK